MPDLGERTLCSEKIFVPPSFPSIMKGYCKAAIRTQPYDLLRWSAAYFRALANGENPPVKERLEFPPSISPLGLTPGYLKILVNQLGKEPTNIVTTAIVKHKWRALCLPSKLLDRLLSILGEDSFPWLRFLGLATGSISSTLTQTMILLCELLTDDPEGGRAAIPIDVFLDLYQYLAELDCGPSVTEDTSENSTNDYDKPKLQSEDSVNSGGNDVTDKGYGGSKDDGESMEDKSVGERYNSRSQRQGSCELSGIGSKMQFDQIEKVIDFMTHWAGRQDGMIMPRNIRHWMCPPLDNSLLFGA